MKFRLYTKKDCPYCHMAIRLLTEKEKEFECYALDAQPQLLQEIKNTYRWETVPVVIEIHRGKKNLSVGLRILKNTLLKVPNYFKDKRI